MSPLRKKFETEAKEYFAKYGYKRRRTSYGGHIYQKKMSENESILVYFDATSCNVPHHLFTIPLIGVRYENVEVLMKQLKPAANCEGTPVSSPLGSLLPKATTLEYKYNEETDPTSFWEEVLQTIKTYGEPYAERLCDMDTLIDYIENLGVGSAYQFIMPRLPILYYLRGYDISRGMNYIKRGYRKDPGLGEFVFPESYIEGYKKLYETPPAGLESTECKAAQGTATPAADESKGKISGLINKVKSLF